MACGFCAAICTARVVNDAAVGARRTCAFGGSTFVHAEAQLSRRQSGILLKEKIVQLGPLLAADLDGIFKPFRSLQKPRARLCAGEECWCQRSSRAARRSPEHRRRSCSRHRQWLARDRTGVENTFRRRIWCRPACAGFAHHGVKPHAVSECAAAIDGDSERGASFAYALRSLGFWQSNIHSLAMSS